jgi:hypothetical protein
MRDHARSFNFRAGRWPANNDFGCHLPAGGAALRADIARPPSRQALVRTRLDLPGLPEWLGSRMVICEGNATASATGVAYRSSGRLYCRCWGLGVGRSLAAA